MAWLLFEGVPLCGTPAVVHAELEPLYRYVLSLCLPCTGTVESCVWGQ